MVDHRRRLNGTRDQRDNKMKLWQICVLAAVGMFMTFVITGGFYE